MDNTSDVSEREDDSGIESSAPDPTDNNVYIRIAVTDLKIQKCLQFRQDELVWSAKQTVLANMAKDLKDGLNYGFYCPPQNGKAGKFLDEERPLSDYPLPGPIGFLEFKYKRRVYKVMQINPKKLRQLHTKANLKQFVESVKLGNIEKITKFTNRGLDPNFHDHDSGETPLILSTALQKPRDVIIALVSGGAHIDFRNKSGMTAMHYAALHGNTEAIKTLLDLSASPNYKDTRGLTPLYHCILHDTTALCTEILLHDHSVVGVPDERGWQEIHQAVKLGRVQHLEHLLFYGAEMNVQNSSGNTPLHVAAVNNQESCARVLLFRGADKTIQNFANQDAFQVAVIAGNCELADVIKDFKSSDVVPFQEVPKYNERRRATAPLSLHKLQRSRSDPRLNLSFSPAPQQNGHPSSPCLSNSSLPHYMSNGHINLYDSLSSGNHSGTLQRKQYDSDSPRSMSISSSGSASAFSVYGYSNYGRRSSVVSDTALFASNKKRLYPAMPGRSFIAVKNYTATDESELSLRKGKFVEVISVGEGGYWEGRVKDQEGWFPSNCVQEVDMRRRGSIPGPRIEDETVMINRRTLAALAASDGENSPRTVVLQRGTNGFGFVLRGAKAQTTVGSSLDFTPTADFPALQYLDRVDKQSPADRAGLKPGDFLLEINGEVVVNATHEHTVNLIKYSGDTLAMKVITVKPLSPDGLERDIHADGTRTLPMKKKAAPAPPRRDPHTSLTASRATGRSIRESLAELEKLDMNLAQFDEADLDSAAVRRGVDLNNKTASIRTRQAQARLTAYEIEDMMTRQGMTQADVHHSASSQNKPMIPVGPVLPKTYNSVADMKKKNGNGTLNKNHRARSTPNLAQDGEMQIYQNSELASQRHVTHIEPNQSPSVYNRQASTPDTSTLGRRMANGSPALQREQMYAVPNTPQRRYGSVENVLEASVPAGGKYIIPPHPQEPAPAPPRPRSGIPPPPDHPPPIPPHDRTQTEVVKITKSPTYANVSAHIQQQKRSESDYESSFRPGIGARLNKEPIVPPSVVIPKLSHSRTTSNISSGSDNSGDQKPLNVRGTVEIFEQSSSGHSPHVQKDPVETATKFVKDHPGANVLYTTETKGQNGGQVYEPEPDYDDTDQGVVSHVPEVRSLRESWQISGHKTRQAPATPPSSRASHLVTQSSRVTESHYTPPQRNKVTTPTTPTTPRTPDQEKGGSMSAFSSAIKAAAVAREQKKSSPPVQPPPPPPPAVTREHASQAARSNGGPNAPPPPPPPPPPSAAEPRASPKPVRNGTPPQVRRQVEERRNDPHAALMAAIAKRRGLVDQAKGGESIEEKIQKNKKASPVAKPPVIKTESRPAPKSQAPPPPKELPKPNPAPVPPTSNTSSPSPSDEPTNFRAMAERARQEYLQKKAAGTLDRRKGSPSPHSRSSPQSPTSPNEEEKENEPQKAKTLNNQCSPIPAVSQQTNNSNNSGNSTGLGDIASVIAQRAMARQKSTSGMVDGSGNKMNEKSSHSTVYKSPASNSNGGSRQRGDGDKGLEVKGATVDVSHTESPRDERLSVFARAKMFESSKNQNRTSVTNGADLPFDLPPPVIEMNGTYVVDDIPPPMITPPPPEFDYSHSSELGIVSNGHTQNGHETVGWVINSSPPRYSTQEYAIRSKMATTNSYSVSPSLKETLVDEIQVDFIPPPPLFDGDLGPEPQLHTGKVVAEDAASMVSSLSTLSTVSSSEHDSYQHDSSGYSSSRNRFTPVHTSSVQSEEVFLEVAPPPPGFDDGGEDFIPPPMGFGLSGPDAQPQPVNNLRNNLRSTGRASQGYHSKAVEEWNTQDICDWLDSVNLGHLAIHFIRAGVRGDQLSRMGGQDYQMLGITNPDHQALVERAVRRVQLNR